MFHNNGPEDSKWFKFVDDDWLAANDLLPPTPPVTNPPSPELRARRYSNDSFRGTKVRALRLKPVTAVSSDSTCASAIETMREKGFDQLPVLAPKGRKLVGLVTLGNLLSRISHGRATGQSPISEVMFDFTKISEVVTDPKDIGGKDLMSNEKQDGSRTPQPQHQKRKFIEITMDTPLSALNRFFEWQSAAIVTERDETGTIKPVAVVTKVDLLTWLLHHNQLAG